MPASAHRLTLLLLSFALSLLLGASPKGSTATSPHPATPVMKEKELPPAGIRYIYIDPATPRYLIERCRAKRLPVAFLFDQRQGDWLRTLIPTLAGTAPLIFVRGALSEMDTTRLKETLEFFDYEATLVHVKVAAVDRLPALPLTAVAAIELRDKKGKKEFVMARGTQKPETARMRSPLDERDLGDPFGVTGYLSFTRHGFHFAAAHAVADLRPVPGDRTVVFSQSEKELEKFIEKW